MKVTILGSGTAIPQVHRSPTGCWITEENTSILVDCGAGTSQRLVAAGGKLQDLDAILLSHAHLDHFADLPSILFSLNLPSLARTAPLTVVHSIGLQPYIDGLKATFGKWMAPTGFKVKWTALEPGFGTTVGRVKIRTFAVDHHPSSVGFILQGTESIAIPSDTALCQTLVEAVQGADNLIVECSNTDGTRSEGHMTPSDVAYLAREAQVKRLIVTHQYPEAERAGVAKQIQNELEGTTPECVTIEATDGMVIDLGRPSTKEAPVPASQEADELDPDALQDEMIALMNQGLGRIDSGSIANAKRAPQERAGSSRGRPTPAARGSWTHASLSRLRANKTHRNLLKEARSQRFIPELNLHGENRENALRRLSATVQTWALSSVRFGRIITGKGKHSESLPVVKLATVNWLDGGDGVQFVTAWAPEFAADGVFGSVVVKVRRSLPGDR